MLSNSFFSLHHLEVAQTVLADTEAELATFVYDDFLADTQNDSEYQPDRLQQIESSVGQLRKDFEVHRSTQTIANLAFLLISTATVSMFVTAVVTQKVGPKSSEMQGIQLLDR